MQRKTFWGLVLCESTRQRLLWSHLGKKRPKFWQQCKTHRQQESYFLLISTTNHYRAFKSLLSCLPWKNLLMPGLSGIAYIAVSATPCYFSHYSSPQNNIQLKPSLTSPLGKKQFLTMEEKVSSLHLYCSSKIAHVWSALCLSACMSVKISDIYLESLQVLLCAVPVHTWDTQNLHMITALFLHVYIKWMCLHLDRNC